MTNSINLKSEDLELTIEPERGALVTRFYSIHDKFDILKPVTETETGNAGMFSLIPYSNRIRGGSFVYWGIKRNVPRNRKDIADPIHGDGWLAVWTVTKQTENTAELTFSHNKAEGFPFSYTASEEFSLKNNILSINITIRNTGDLPMPCGLGIHPHFNKAGAVNLKFKNRVTWADENALTKQMPKKTDVLYNYENGKILDNNNIDLCFGGFDGHAEIDWVEKNFYLSIDAHEDFNHIILYSPKDSNFFCLEPATNANDAFNLASRGITGTGIQTIEPDEVLEEKIEFRLNRKK